ncbi:hypothetical protein B0H15DRAFT_973033 [Mycena belliarum]|uniref:Uncharacterized protein n=1 Tax=Mycena belliarum TaxID=1033014 RepID=A0AAD6U8X6_9AGAR|nr:hypothetical protein B0H15DRAFT_973033 [Mycena belliae]
MGSLWRALYPPPHEPDPRTKDHTSKTTLPRLSLRADSSCLLGAFIAGLFAMSTRAPRFEDWEAGQSYCAPSMTELLQEHTWMWLLKERVKMGWVPAEDCRYGYNCYTQTHNVHAEQKDAPSRSLFRSVTKLQEPRAGLAKTSTLLLLSIEKGLGTVADVAHNIHGIGESMRETLSGGVDTVHPGSKNDTGPATLKGPGELAVGSDDPPLTSDYYKTPAEVARTEPGHQKGPSEAEPNAPPYDSAPPTKQTGYGATGGHNAYSPNGPSSNEQLENGVPPSYVAAIGGPVADGEEQRGEEIL